MAEFNGLRVLIAEDDSTLRKLLAASLAKKGCQVREAENGRAAKSILELNENNFDLLITDIRMPEMDGIELLKYVRSKSQLPVLMMTGFSEILESHSAHDLGANHFLAKPFRNEEFLKAIETVMTPPAAAATVTDPEAEVPSDSFCRIHIDEFVTAKTVVSDIYIRLTDEKYVKIANAGDSIPTDRVEAYRAKGANYLFVNTADFGRYVHFNIQVAQAVSAAEDKISREAKVKLLRHTSQVMVQNCYIGVIEKQQFQAAQCMVQDMVKLCSSEGDLLYLLQQMSTANPSLYSHSVAVSVYSCIIANMHGWKSVHMQSRVALAGLMHDIGKREIPEEILQKTRVKLTVEDTKLLESHPVRGRDILRDIKGLPEEISQIVSNHHEYHNGTGYPMRLKGETIHPISRLIQVVDQFCYYFFPSKPGEKQELTPELAYEKLVVHHGADLDQTYLRLLGLALKVVPSEKVA